MFFPILDSLGPDGGNFHPSAVYPFLFPSPVPNHHSLLDEAGFFVGFLIGSCFLMNFDFGMALHHLFFEVTGSGSGHCSVFDDFGRLRL